MLQVRVWVALPVRFSFHGEECLDYRQNRLFRQLPGSLLTLALAPALTHSGRMNRQFDHEKLNVYQASLEFITWATELIAKVESRAAVKDQLDRASTSIPLNIAEGNGKYSIRDRCRFLDFARGSALECAACLDVLVAKRLTPVEAVISGKAQLFEIVSMLMGLISSVSSRIGEEQAAYSSLADHEQEQE